MSFFESLLDEVGARRRQLRRKLGDRGQSLFEFGLVGALALGSVGLFVLPHMFAAAPWGLAALPVFLAGYVGLDAWRQSDLARNGETKARIKAHRRFALALSLCAGALGAAAFWVAMAAGPEREAIPALDDIQWAPPRDAAPAEILPSAP